LTGIRYKLAHQRAEKAAWSSGDAEQRRRLLQILEERIGTLRQEPAPREKRGIRTASRT